MASCVCRYSRHTNRFQRDIHRYDIWMDSAARASGCDNSSVQIDDATWDNRDTIASHNRLRRSDRRSHLRIRNPPPARIFCRARGGSFDSRTRVYACVGVSSPSLRPRADGTGIRPRTGRKPSADPVTAATSCRASFRQHRFSQVTLHHHGPRDCGFRAVALVDHLSIPRRSRAPQRRIEPARLSSSNSTRDNRCYVDHSIDRIEKGAASCRTISADQLTIQSVNFPWPQARFSLSLSLSLSPSQFNRTSRRRGCSDHVMTAEPETKQSWRVTPFGVTPVQSVMKTAAKRSPSLIACITRMSHKILELLREDDSSTKIRRQCHFTLLHIFANLCSNKNLSF